ncbi:HD-GYP domain-containing protein [Petroclostridium sp. X23]|uniref:HD-GYP domain-containing protein n=1 Tax=Petroclostridium sp. X23 TaxID=3045146 RepID=UPI0024AD083A|nr:HD-GYP domain-containing protein [Petroclostridium sp. X23]WHH61351.1 HD-GYP domain-containing protein [Petroclostridium sp. X23]
MCKICAPVSLCNIGDVLAEDIINDNGVTLVARHTVVNSYIKDRLSEIGISSVWLYKPDVLTDNQKCEERFNQFKESYKESVLAARQILQEISINGTVNYHKLETISKTIHQNIIQSGHIIKCLAEVRDVDEYTYTHCVNVAFYSMLIAKWLNLSETKIQEVIQAGLLHDIGKVKVPCEILNKISKFTSEEFEVMKKHSDYGYEMIKGIVNINENIKNAIIQHHERIDGSGYPKGLMGDSIEIYAKIVAVADVYDAMTQNRVYKKKVSPFEAFQMFLTTGISYFDTTVLTAFLKNLAVNYTGTKVLLNNGETGEIVYIPPQDIACPIVEVKSRYIDLSREKDIRVMMVL